MRKYDPAGFELSTTFYWWTRHIDNMPHDSIWEFMEEQFPSLEFRGYPDESWSNEQTFLHMIEIESFQPFGFAEPPNDICLNESCSWCKVHPVCPIIHYWKEIIAHGMPSNIKRARNYNRWMWHLAKAERMKKERNKGWEIHKAKTIWFGIRQIHAGDFTEKQIIDYNENQTPLQLITW